MSSSLLITHIEQQVPAKLFLSMLPPNLPTFVQAFEGTETCFSADEDEQHELVFSCDEIGLTALSKVIHASRHWAKTSVACEREAGRLQAALTANTEDMQAAKTYVLAAKEHLAKLEQLLLYQQTQSGVGAAAVGLAR